jgi:hypothetical protein
MLFSACGFSSEADESVLGIQNHHFKCTTDWAPGAYSKIKGIEHLFVRSDSKQFDCSELEEFFENNGLIVNTSALTEVDTALCSMLFGDYQNDLGSLCGSFLFSVERKIHDFHPITVFQHFGVVDRPMVMVLCNSRGDIINTLEVANLYGEIGGCLSSEFINDSTLYQTFRWDEYGIDFLSNQEIWERLFLLRETTISSVGRILEKDLKSWLEVD